MTSRPLRRSRVGSPGAWGASTCTSFPLAPTPSASRATKAPAGSPAKRGKLWVTTRTRIERRDEVRCAASREGSLALLNTHGAVVKAVTRSAETFPCLSASHPHIAVLGYEAGLALAHPDSDA